MNQNKQPMITHDTLLFCIAIATYLFGYFYASLYVIYFAFAKLALLYIIMIETSAHFIHTKSARKNQYFGQVSYCFKEYFQDLTVLLNLKNQYLCTQPLSTIHYAVSKNYPFQTQVKRSYQISFKAGLSSHSHIYLVVLSMLSNTH